MFLDGTSFLARSAIFPDARIRARVADSSERLESLSRLTLLALVYLASIYQANHSVITRREFCCVFSFSVRSFAGIR